MVVLTSVRVSGGRRGAERVRHGTPRSVSKLWVAVTYALTGVFKEKIGPPVNVLIAAPACVGRLSARDQPDRALLVQRDQVGHDLLPLELEHVVDVREVRQKLLVNVLVEARDQALYLRDKSVAVDDAGIQVGKRSIGELRLQRTQHGLDRRFCRVLTVESLRDQPGQRRPGKCLGRCRQQPAIFQMLEQQDPTAGTASTFALSSLSAHRSPDLLSVRSRFPLSMRVPIKTKMRAIAFAWRAYSRCPHSTRIHPPS